MDPVRLRFAVQAPDDTVSGTVEAIVEQINPHWVRFRTPQDVLAKLGESLTDTQAKENHIVMFIYLESGMVSPVRAIGRVVWYERTPQTAEGACSVVVQFHEIAQEERDRIQAHLDRGAPPEPDGSQQRQIRRQSDYFFQEIAQMVEILANMSEGRREQFGEQFTRLVAVKNTLGRRLEDKELGDAICHHVERLASNVARLMAGNAGLRRVRIRKVTGKEVGTVAKDKILVGWEEAPPEMGRSYCLYIAGGGVFRSAEVTQVLKDHFRTRNSLYEVQVM